TGIFPEDAKLIAQHYGAQSGAGSDKHVARAQSHLFTLAQTSYIAGETDEAAVTAALPAAGVQTAAIPEIVAAWNEARTLIRKQLTPAQVKKAYAEAVPNEATGASWTKDDALAALISR